MTHIRSIEIRNPQTGGNFPFNLPVVLGWQPLSFESPVTFFVGENGSGKSTILETIACAVGSITIGSQSVKTDPTLGQVRQLARQMKLIWNKRTSRGFFLRAEDFFGFIKQQARQRAELEQELRTVDQEFSDRSEYARSLARGPLAGQLADMQQRYGEGLDTHSHGESYLELFQGRFVPGGLYLLDEPEAALSPLRQLGFLSLLKEMIGQDAQFIIATHSPILMAYPGATVLSFDQVPIQAVDWESLEHVSLTRDFLNAPDQFLRHI
ncbi:MAG: AAA family ATPase [Anaerolineales bacterium]|nr:AAA family ATPase [Anaerolineales bacterium]